MKTQKPPGPKFIFKKVNKKTIRVFLDIGVIESEREAECIPDGYFFAGPSLCQSREEAAKRLLYHYLMKR